MKVHIVARDFENECILGRLARALQAETGWTLSASPNTRADVNYFQTYIDLAERFSDWHQTRTAAYFSHYETTQPFKTFFWDSVVGKADLRVCTAAQYRDMCAPFGPTVLARPPIDARFVIADRPAHDTPRIGVSGFVTRGGRKGEHLVARLAASDLGERIDIVASGRGWPVRDQKERPWSDMAGFYQSLDAYLCTASIEGIPMPPLEALACGVPVVVPQGVGLLDELDGPGVYRYAVGDFDAMRGAVQAALDTPVDREALRAAVIDTYSPANWAADHAAAFEKLLNGESVAAPVVMESDRHGQRGVYYVAYGDPARKCALGAIESFKTHMAGVPVALVSDRPLGPEDVFIPQPDSDIGGRIAKIKVNELAPVDWTYILYLDADTEVVGDINYLYQCLEDGWELVICKNPSKYHLARGMIRSDNHDECDATFKALGTDEIMQLNGGVFGFQRSPRTSAFFDAWLAEWHKYGKRDQGALLRALRTHPLKTWVLPQQWNHITRYEDGREEAAILHFPMTARRWRGQIAGRIDSPEAWAAVQAFERGKR